MNKIFSIAIDGPAGAGKSTIARAAAGELGAMYLDTGAMYRTVGLYFLRKNMLEDKEAIARMVGDTDIAVKFVGDVQHMLLDGEDVSEAIRTPEASMAASAVGAIPEVRERLVKLQQDTAKGISIIMDGRDIGTKVLPDATLKLYITASAEVRALRRYNELREKGERPLFHEVLDDIVERDYNDTHRAASPLMRAEDAYLLDTSNMTLKQVLAEVKRLAGEVIGG
ncbi:MAG: (d)CMP kinase [Clostridia bacterium]|nr:(d)CMP kinase [Clostridia bacterium]MBP3653302.1 (d)CMP kinase [Clostridia bacterium]